MTCSVPRLWDEVPLTTLGMTICWMHRHQEEQSYSLEAADISSLICNTMCSMHGVMTPKA